VTLRRRIKTPSPDDEDGDDDDDYDRLLTDYYKEINCLNFVQKFSNNINDVISVRIR
jgi:hypothetical protein